MSISKLQHPATHNRYERIVKAAAILFAQHGFEATTLRQLGSSCGIKAGSLYYYIDSKSDLLFDICNETLTRLNSITAVELKSNRSMTSLIETFFDFKRSNDNELKVAFGEHKHLTMDQLATVLSHQTEYVKLIAETIAHGTSNQSKECEPAELAEAIFVSLYGATLLPKHLTIDAKFFSHLIAG